MKYGVAVSCRPRWLKGSRKQRGPEIYRTVALDFDAAISDCRQMATPVPAIALGHS